MQWSLPLKPGRLLQRYKRFFADVELDDGRKVTAHCANPGSMRTCLELGGRVWLSFSGNPKRKLSWTWEIAEVDGTMVYVNPARANDLVADAIKSRVVEELGGYDILRREVRYGTSSRVDFVLAGGPRPHCYVEVKCATMGIADGAAFPDSVTARGTRHLEELIEVKQSGARAVLLFCVARDGVQLVRPADDIDPVYGATLRRAVHNGVEVLAYGCRVNPREVRIDRRMPVVL